MKCLILAAGYATRLYPLTENFPKPLLKVGEKSILDWLVDDLVETTDIISLQSILRIGRIVKKRRDPIFNHFL